MNHLRRRFLDRLRYDTADLVGDRAVVEPRSDDLIRAGVDRLSLQFF